MIDQRRNDEWLTVLHERHFEPMRRLAHYQLHPFGMESYAEDIVQDVFEEAIKQSGKLADHPNIAGWLMKTTHYKCNNARRLGVRAAQRTAFSIDHPEAPEIADRQAELSLNEVLETQQNLDEVMEKLKQEMTDEEYRLYVQIYEQKRPIDVLAQEYNISNSALRTRTCRVRQKMLRLIKNILV